MTFAERLKSLRASRHLSQRELADQAGLARSSISMYECGAREPSAAEVMEIFQGTDLELPVMLALCLGLRLSEIRGFRCSDFGGQTLTIRQTVVDTADGPVVKTTGKTAQSLRRLATPPFVAELINLSTPYQNYLKTGADGLLEPRSRAAIYGPYQRGLEKEGLSMTFHELRALNASVMLALGVPDKYAMQRGGWKTPAVMKAHYQQTLDRERRHFDDVVDGYFEQIYNASDNFSKTKTAEFQGK